MITPRHDKDGFFKYYTAESAKRTLMYTSRKWSTPLLFNDPFDNQFDLYFESPNEDIAKEMRDWFLKIITSPDPIPRDRFGPLTPQVEVIRQIHQQHPDFQYTDEELAYLLEGSAEGMEQVIKFAPEANEEIRRVMADTTIFCMSESHDNLLMWSHYAGNHTGAVIKFLSLPEVDSPLICAEPVRYSSQIPRLEFSEIMNGKMQQHIIKIVTLSKSEVWSYEKEWRIIAALRDKTQSCEILPYAPEEVGQVYLGCRISKEDAEEIIGITRWKYPKATIFQAGKHDHEFRLVFKNI